MRFSIIVLNDMIITLRYRWIEDYEVKSTKSICDRIALPGFEDVTTGHEVYKRTGRTKIRFAFNEPLLQCIVPRVLQRKGYDQYNTFNWWLRDEFRVLPFNDFNRNEKGHVTCCAETKDTFGIGKKYREKDELQFGVRPLITIDIDCLR